MSKKENTPEKKENQDFSEIQIPKGFENEWNLASAFEYKETAGNDVHWNALKMKLDSHAAEPVLKTIWIKKYAWAAVASLVLLLVAGAGTWLANTRNEAVQIAEIHIQTGNNEFKTVDLADGSVVQLNSNSRLIVASNYNVLNRNITLVGQADFEVTKNPEILFVVKTDKTITKVLGTGFDIQAYPNENVSIFVKHGKVSFGGQSNKLILEKQQAAVYTSSNGTTAIANFTNQNWQNGEWILKKNTLSEIADMFYHRYSKKLKYAEKDGTRQFTGKFKASDTAEQIVATLEQALQIKLIIE